MIGEPSLMRWEMGREGRIVEVEQWSFVGGGIKVLRQRPQGENACDDGSRKPVNYEKIPSIVSHCHGKTHHRMGSNSTAHIHLMRFIFD